MTIEFDLSRAHPDFQREIPEILEPLVERYPGAKLRSVRLYDPRPGDTSMGATYPGAVISLNQFWFARDPKYLREAAVHHAIIEVGGVPMGWHGPMIWEPRQLLTHEFGHIVWQCLPDAKAWACERWQAATRNPHLAPGGYALTSAPEFFGEEFALVHLGLATDEENADLSELLAPLR